MIVGGRTYDILSFMQEGDGKSVVGYLMVERAKRMYANLGKEDGKHILEHQDEIPVVLREKVAFVFPDWRHPDDPERACYVCWYGEKWVRRWCWLGRDDWYGSDRVLCRRK